MPRKITLAAIAAVVVILGAAGAYVGIHQAHKTDTASALCRSMAESDAKPNDTKKMTTQQYADLRKRIQAVDDPAVRDPALRVVDDVWQIKDVSDDDALSALPILGDIMSQYGALTGACAMHGVTLPPLTSASGGPTAGA
jgi:uncharacterized protein (UPF0264 family)